MNCQWNANWMDIFIVLHCTVVSKNSGIIFAFADFINWEQKKLGFGDKLFLI